MKAEKESANFDFVLEPYKLENARLSKENNELYLELMKLREQSGQHIKGKFLWLLKFLPFLFYMWEILVHLWNYWLENVIVFLLTVPEI